MVFVDVLQKYLLTSKADTSEASTAPLAANISCYNHGQKVFKGCMML